ncbi:sensor histidine kinase [Novosphingobium sp. Gsoil 351]|uniref:sensor histidine kinase n=1 Tax=Novosphingobium sp. Gsoil 351 TaxID=2675225 RepID=UPI00351B318B
MRELRHRVRNTLTIVQAMAQQSARSDPTQFIPVFSKRLSALANAHDVMFDDPEGGCDLASIIEKGCAAFHEAGNFAIDGPKCCVPDEVCVPLSLALHELCTNALKYGALSVPAGRVHVNWTPPVDGKTTLVWEETGGPEVKPPTRSGMGSALLSSPEIGKADLQYHPRGVRCVMMLKVKDQAQALSHKPSPPPRVEPSDRASSGTLSPGAAHQKIPRIH